MAPPGGLALQQQLRAPEAGGAASKVVMTAPLWVLGLVTASVAITLAVREPLPPVPGLSKNAYLLALSVAFFAGVAGVMAAVCTGGWPTTPAAPAGRRHATATGRKLAYSAAAAVVAVSSLVVVSFSLLW